MNFNEALEQLKDYIPILIPIAIFQISFQVYCLVKLFKKEKVKYLNKGLWAGVIILFRIMGSVIFLLVEREE